MEVVAFLLLVSHRPIVVENKKKIMIKRRKRCHNNVAWSFETPSHVIIN